MITHEYAGFKYQMEKVLDRWVAVPLPGQHPAAAKAKHLRAAVETFEQEAPHDVLQI